MFKEMQLYIQSLSIICLSMRFFIADDIKNDFLKRSKYEREF